jgi:hypothetical protein
MQHNDPGEFIPRGRFRFLSHHSDFRRPGRRALRDDWLMGRE